MKTVMNFIKKSAAICLSAALIFTMVPAAAFAAEDSASDNNIEEAVQDKLPKYFYKALTLEEMLTLAEKNHVYDMSDTWRLMGDFDPAELFGLEEFKADGGTVERTEYGAGDPYWMANTYNVDYKGNRYQTTGDIYGLGLFSCDDYNNEEVVKGEIERVVNEKFLSKDEAGQWTAKVVKYSKNNISGFVDPSAVAASYAPYIYYLQKGGYGDYKNSIYAISLENKVNKEDSSFMFVAVTNPNEVVETIEISKLPDKLDYNDSEDLDVSGGKIMITYMDGQTKEIEMTKDHITDAYAGVDQAGKREITVSYRGVKTSYKVNFVQKTLESIEIYNPKTEYYVGDELDLTYSHLKLNYDNGESIFVEIDETMISGFDTQTPGKKTLTVTYDGKTFDYEITVNPIDVSYIVLESLPTKTVYKYTKEYLDVSGGTLFVMYTNGDTEIVPLEYDMVKGFDSTLLGEQQITVSYHGIETQFTVTTVQLDMSGIEIKGLTEKTYTGRPIEQEIEVWDGEEKLEEDIDYEVSYVNNIDVTDPTNPAKVVVTGLGYYYGEKTEIFDIVPAEITEQIQLEYDSVEYTGSPLMPKVTIDGLVEGKDFSVEYENNTEITDKAVVRVTGIGNYTGVHTLYFAITKVDISNYDFSLEYDSAEYDGTEKLPQVLVENLVIGRDYEVEYQNNVEAGKASVVITGIGNYTGTVIKEFEITDNKGIDSILGGERTKRVAGRNRYETATLVADNLKTSLGIDKFNTIIVASGNTYADALEGSYLAKVKNAPILLTNQYNEGIVKDYIRKNLKYGGKVYLLGGTGAVSKTLENSLKFSYGVERLGGADRFATNIKILNEAGIGNEELLICSAWDFADSLSASAVGKPILLVSKGLTDSQKDLIKNTSNDHCYLIGGTGAVSTNVEKELEAFGKVTERVAGSNRYQTSVAVARKFFDANKDAVMLAYGNDFPDGLVGGPLGMSVNAPLLLINERNIASAAEYVEVANAKKAIALGGPALISQGAIDTILPNNEVEK